MQPKVSIIINTFNRPKMLKQAVYSVLCQTLENWELMLAVDHKRFQHISEIGNEITAICEDFALNDDRIHVDFTDLEPGEKSLNRFAHNINRAFKVTTGQYISYLCDDDLFTPHRCSVMAKFLDDNPLVEVCYDAQLIYSIPEDCIKEMRGPFGVISNPAGHVNHNSVMHRSECFEKVGGWVEDAPARLGDAYFFAKLSTIWPFHPVDIIGEIMRMGEQNCWSGKPQSEAEKTQVGAFA